MPRWDAHFNMRVNSSHPRILQTVAQIKALASVIRNIPIPPHVQERLDHLNVLRAVRGTTGIEGTELSEEEVSKILQVPPRQRVLPRSRAREEKEVRNAHVLMRRVGQMLSTNPDAPLSEALIHLFHKILTEEIEYPYNTPGLYRTFPVQAGSYVPPESGEDIRRLMSEFIQWFNTREPTGWDRVIRAIVAHFYIVSIHPFGDGNGRTSRAVESYLLYQAGVNARGFYSLANYYYRRRPEYVEKLDLTRFQTDPDLTPFVLFGLEGLVEELEAVHEEILSEVRLISFRDFARETLLFHNKLGTHVGARLLMFLLGLEQEPVSLRVLRTGGHTLSALYADVTSKTLMRDINFLTQHQLVLVQGDELRANLGIMTQFTAQPPSRLRSRAATPGRSPARAAPRRARRRPR